MPTKFAVRVLAYLKSIGPGKVEGHRIAEGFEDVGTAIANLTDKVNALKAGTSSGASTTAAPVISSAGSTPGAAGSVGPAGAASTVPGPAGPTGPAGESSTAYMLPLAVGTIPVTLMSDVFGQTIGVPIGE